jgi:flagellar hook-associated protein FlgK
MAGFNIGLSGLNASRRALDVIGNNIANSATEGYHKQRADFSSIAGIGDDVGSGVKFEGTTRMIDKLLEQEMLKQDSLLQQTTRELRTLSTIENNFAELSGEDSGLSTTIDDFFNTLNELAANPDQAVWQNKAVSSAKTLAQKFRSVGNFLSDLNSQIELEVDNTLDSVNSLLSHISELNQKIESQELAGKDTNSLRDLRSKSLNELTRYMSVKTQERKNGVLDVTCSGVPAVVGSSAFTYVSDITEDGQLGIAVKDTYTYHTELQGGEIGGLLSLRNNYISDVQSDIDKLAGGIIGEINNYHTQGIGSDGSFDSLTGGKNNSGQLSDFEYVTDGSFFVRIKNTQTGEITREEVTVDKANDSLNDIASRISALDGLSADISSGNVLGITSEPEYEFDFSPAVLPDPVTSNLNGDSGSNIPDVEIDGLFTGDKNTEYTFTAESTGEIGNTENLEVRVEKNGEFLKNINVGSDYAAKDSIGIENGISVSLGVGQLNSGEEFTVNAYADTDTSGLLSEAGMNTLFSGDGAIDMQVCQSVLDSPQRLATSVSAKMTDSYNINRIANLKDQSVDSLDSLSPVEFYQRIVSDLGQEINIKKMGEQNLQSMVQNLENQQTEISGVDINEQAAQLLVFQQMYQAMSKYMVSTRDMNYELMNLIE